MAIKCKELRVEYWVKPKRGQPYMRTRKPTRYEKVRVLQEHEFVEGAFICGGQIVADVDPTMEPYTVCTPTLDIRYHCQRCRAPYYETHLVLPTDQYELETWLNKYMEAE